VSSWEAAHDDAPRNTILIGDVPVGQEAAAGRAAHSGDERLRTATPSGGHYLDGLSVPIDYLLQHIPLLVQVLD